MSSDGEYENDSKRKLVSDADEPSDSRTDAADCTDKLLGDTDETTEHQASDFNDDDDDETEDSDTENEQSVHDLLKSIVEGEEIKLIEASKKRKSRSSSERKHSENTQQDETIRGTTLDSVESVGNNDDHRKLSKLSLVLPDTSTWQNVTSKDPDRPTTAMVLEKKRLAMKLLQRHESDTGKIVCGIICILVICGLGAGLAFIGYFFGMEDLYILGGIFGGGGVLFAIGFVVVRCMSKEETADYSVLYRQTVEA